MSNGPSPEEIQAEEDQQALTKQLQKRQSDEDEKTQQEQIDGLRITQGGSGFSGGNTTTG